MGQVYVNSLQLSNLISHIFISIFNIFSLIFTLAVLFLLLTKQNKTKQCFQYHGKGGP